MSTSDFEERVVTVPLRDANDKPVQERADFAMRIVRDTSVNEAVWANGRENPPSKVRVRAARFVEDGEPVVEAEYAE
jgi:large subunit ribosomal protein L31e